MIGRALQIFYSSWKYFLALFVKFISLLLQLIYKTKYSSCTYLGRNYQLWYIVSIIMLVLILRICCYSSSLPLQPLGPSSPWQRKPVLPWVKLPPASWLSPMVKQQPWNTKLSTSALPRSPSLMEVCMKWFRVFIELTHWGRDKMAVISQTFSNAFSWIKMFKFWIKFHSRLFPRVHMTIF